MGWERGEGAQQRTKLGDPGLFSAGLGPGTWTKGPGTRLILCCGGGGEGKKNRCVGSEKILKY